MSEPVCGTKGLLGRRNETKHSKNKLYFKKKRIFAHLWEIKLSYCWFTKKIIPTPFIHKSGEENKRFHNFSVYVFTNYSNTCTVHLLFCTVTNKCTIFSQIITLFDNIICEIIVHLLVIAQYIYLFIYLFIYTGSSKKMDGIWNRYNLKSTGRIYTIGVLKCS